VNGKKHGDWVYWWADGCVDERQYVDGKLHGKWVQRSADGDVSESCWKNGKAIDC